MAFEHLVLWDRVAKAIAAGPLSAILSAVAQAAGGSFNELSGELALPGTAASGSGGTRFFGDVSTTSRPDTPEPVVWVGYTGVTPVNAVSGFDVVLTFDAPVGGTTTTTTTTAATTTTTTAAATTTTTTVATTTTTTAYTTTFLDSFADGAGTASPAGWTSAGWNPTSVSAWNEDAGFVDVVKVSAARWAATADAFGSTTDGDVIVKLSTVNRILGDYHGGAMVGISGTTSATANGIMAYLRNEGKVFLSQYINGTAQAGIEVDAPAWDAAGTVVYLRLNVQGVTARVKVWKDGTPEPGTWLASYTVTPQAGKVGIFSGGAKTVRYYYFAAAPTGSASTE